ncbi:PREDICTED: lachesin-like, partial [Papilio polytes]|uniref:lachesin-like n=1 Tax=Papilio polytes TaxID=76194 RepID=UPI0006763B8B
RGGGTRLAKRYVGLYTGPYFDPTAPNNITAQLGTHAYLPCKIRQLSNKSVSWIRRRDAHILTVDRFTFIADERFQAFLVEATDTWTLQVKYVQARDAGLYECQVGTEPKMSHFVQLNVVGEYRLVDIRTERLPPDTTVGNLIIYNPRREDSGNYSCSPSNLDAASVVLHVLSGEQPAAMQHGNAGERATPPRAALLLLLLLLLAALQILMCHDEDDPK